MNSIELVFSFFNTSGLDFLITPIGLIAYAVYFFHINLKEQKLNTLIKLLLFFCLYWLIQHFFIAILPNGFYSILTKIWRLQPPFLIDTFFLIGLGSLFLYKIHSSILQSIFWISILVLTYTIADALTNLFFEFLHTQLIGGTHPVLFSSVTHRLVELFLLGAFAWMIKKWFRPIFTSSLRSASSQLALIGITVLSYLLLVFFVRDIFYSSLYSFTNLSIVISVVILIDVLVLVLYSVQESFYLNLRQTELEARALKAQVREIDRSKEEYEKLRQLKHDLRNEHLAIVSMLETQHVDDALSYLKQKYTQMEDLETFYTSNQTLNFFLNEKAKEAKVKKVSFTPTILLPETLKIPSKILAVVIGNVLDNAFSAIQRLPNHGEVHLQMKLFQNDLLIEVSNPYDPKELNSRKHRQTEGIGLKNVQMITSEYGGIYKTWQQEDFYYTTLLFFDVSIND